MRARVAGLLKLIAAGNLDDFFVRQEESGNSRRNSDSARGIINHHSHRRHLSSVPKGGCVRGGGIRCRVADAAAVAPKAN